MGVFLVNITPEVFSETTQVKRMSEAELRLAEVLTRVVPRYQPLRVNLSYLPSRRALRKAERIGLSLLLVFGVTAVTAAFQPFSTDGGPAPLFGFLAAVVLAEWLLDEGWLAIVTSAGDMMVIIRNSTGAPIRIEAPGWRAEQVVMVDTVKDEGEGIWRALTDVAKQSR